MLIPGTDLADPRAIESVYPITIAGLLYFPTKRAALIPMIPICQNSPEQTIPFDSGSFISWCSISF